MIQLSIYRYHKNVDKIDAKAIKVLHFPTKIPNESYSIAATHSPPVVWTPLDSSTMESNSL